MRDMVGEKYRDIKTKTVYTVTEFDKSQKIIRMVSPNGTKAEVVLRDMVYGWERVYG